MGGIMAKKKSNRGGKREGAGRKRLPNAKRRSISIALSDADLAAIKKFGGHAWAQGILMRAIKRKLSGEG